MPLQYFHLLYEVIYIPKVFERSYSHHKAAFVSNLLVETTVNTSIRGSSEIDFVSEIVDRIYHQCSQRINFI